MNTYCTKCGTPNEPEYKYCKNCGTKLYEENSQPEVKNEDFSGSTYINPEKIIVDTIDGIPSEEMAIFIGKKAVNIMPKFSKMAITNSKISWCWPAALLGFFLGPIGSALWFFYRKIYKPAIILTLIGGLLTIINSILIFNTTSSALNLFAEAFANGKFDEALGSLANADLPATVLDLISSAISDISSFLSFLLCGLFGYNIYKNHCISKINSYKTFQGDQRYYRLGLASIGGVSGGMLAVGIIIMVALENITSIITAIAAMLI